MDKLGLMQAYCAVVEAGSFTRAAERLGRSKAVLSKHVARLEQQLDIRLLQRTTRRLSPTEDGRAYYERCRDILDDIEELETRLTARHARPTGTLRVSAPQNYGELHLPGLLQTFLQRYPGIRLDLQLSDRFLDLASEGIDVALRITRLPDSSLVARRLGETHSVICAAPDYLDRHGRPQTPQDLARHQCILDTNYDSRAVWDLSHNGERRKVPVQGPIRVNSATAAREFALRGLGLAMVPDFVVGDDLRAGRLSAVLEDFRDDPIGIYAVYSHRRHLSMKVRVFVDFLRQALSRHGAGW